MYLGILVAILAFLVYLPTLSFDFVWDDHMQVVANPLILSWRMIPRALESNLWFQISPTGTYYRPFFIIWSIFNHALFGFDPRGWHLLNVVLHVIATSLVFVLLRKLKVGYWTAALATIFFAIHPVHIEPVAWVAAGSDPLMTICFVLAFVAYLEFHESKRSRWLLLSLLGTTCALLSKENAVSFPAVIFLYEWLFPLKDGSDKSLKGAAKSRAAALVALPYVLLDVAYLVQRKHVLHELMQSYSINLTTTFKTIPIVLLHYFRLLILPVGLNGFYYIDPVEHVHSLRFVLSLAGCFALAGFIWYWAKRDKDPLIVFFGIWQILCLAPALYLPNFHIGDFVRDRYLYLPSVGFVFLVARALHDIRPTLGPIRQSWLQYALPTVLALACVYGTLGQEVYWANELVLFYRGYTLSPQNTAAAKFLAAALNRRDEPEKAAPLLEGIVRRDPGDSYSLFTLSVVYSRLGRVEQANQILALAIKEFPQYYLGSFDGLTNAGIAYSNLRRYDEAERSLRKAIQMEPNAVEAHFYLGLVLLRTGRAADGEQQIRQAIAINPTIEDFHWALGLSREMQGDFAEASKEYQEELRLYPESKQALFSEHRLASARPSP